VYLLTFSHICTINYFVISACFCALVFVFEFSGSWEIPFEEISDLSWLGSGAQGAVFLGRLNGQQVAVKKVHNANETDILHLRKLSHPNIIKFKFVYFVISENLAIRISSSSSLFTLQSSLPTCQYVSYLFCCFVVSV